MFMLQAPQLPKPEDVMNAFQNATAQSVNGVLMTLSAPLEFVKGMGIPVPQLPAPPLPGANNNAGSGQQSAMFGIPFAPFVGGQVDVTYEPYTGEVASEGGQQDVTIESGKQKEIWV